MAIDDLEQAAALEPDHISYYQLTLEPNTVFYSKPPPDLPDDELSYAIQEHGHDLLAGHGYERYEISAFSRPGNRCRHNLNYWMFGDYLAAGAGAHGKLTNKSGAIRRYEKPRHPLMFIEQAESGSIDDAERELKGEDIAFEFMLNALRLPGGFTAANYKARTGLAVEPIKERLEAAVAKGMIVPLDGVGWRPTALGLRFQNDLATTFLP